MTNDRAVADAYEVTARRWDHGWELHVPDVGVTQCATLDQAHRQVRDYVATVYDLDSYGGDVTVVPELDGVTDAVRAMQQIAADMEVLTVRADQARTKVLHTMLNQGFSYADIAGALGVSKGRVGQLVKQ